MGPTPLHMPARTSPNVHSAIPVKPRSMPIFSPPLGATNPGQNPRPSDPSPFKSGLFIPCLTKALHFNVQTNPRPSRDPHALILKKSLHLKRETGNGLGHPGGIGGGRKHRHLPPAMGHVATYRWSWDFHGSPGLFRGIKAAAAAVGPMLGKSSQRHLLFFAPIHQKRGRGRKRGRVKERETSVNLGLGFEVRS